MSFINRYNADNPIGVKTALFSSCTEADLNWSASKVIETSSSTSDTKTLTSSSNNKSLAFDHLATAPPIESKTNLFSLDHDDSSTNNSKKPTKKYEQMLESTSNQSSSKIDRYDTETPVGLKTEQLSLGHDASSANNSQNSTKEHEQMLTSTSNQSSSRIDRYDTETPVGLKTELLSSVNRDKHLNTVYDNDEQSSSDKKSANVTHESIQSNQNLPSFEAKVAFNMIDDYTFITYNDETYIYVPQRGYYKKATKGFLRNIITEEIDDLDSCKKSIIDDIIFKIQALTYLEDVEFNPLHLINFNDCVYNIRTNKYLKHSEKYYFNYSINANILTCATDGKYIKSFIKTLCNNNNEKIYYLQELCGILISDIFFKGAIFFIGEHDTGKSTLAKLFKRLFGPEKVSGLTLEKFAGQFDKSGMLDAKINIGGEICKELSKAQIQNFKSITGGDLVHVDIKYKDPRMCVLSCKQLFLGNFLPNLPDDDDAIIDRFKVIYFDNIIPETQRDTELEKKLARDLDWFAQWSLKGLLRYNKNNQKLNPDSSSFQYFNKYISQKNSAISFVKKYLYYDENSLITKNELYQVYSEYCNQLNLRIKSRIKFFKQVQVAFPDCFKEDEEDPRVIIDNVRHRAIKGLAIYPLNNPSSIKK